MSLTFLSANSKFINVLHTNFLQYKLLLFRDVMHQNGIHLITSRAASTQRTRVPLKSKVTTSIAWVLIINTNCSSTFKHHWSNFLVRCYARLLYALLLRPKPLICNILWRHKTSIKSVREDTQKIQCWSNIQQSLSNLNFDLVITSILTLIKSNHHQNNWYWKFTCAFFSKGWGLKHKFSEHMMADISHSLLFSSLF